ncbi:SET domain-containing protein [Polaromonas sp.]|uniref:SET domain-containing protein n=1 Tax=Polaromonas sp. TaxID=1869339 RepID=UPI00352B407E
MTSPTPLIVIAPSGIHGLGAFAAQALPANTLIGIYEGRRDSPAQMAKHDWDDRLTYLFSLSNGDTIDGGRGGNGTRHLNHSCAPNCQAIEEHNARGKLVLKIYTLADVAVAQELFLDYALVIDERCAAADYPCSGDATQCRGSMAAA